MTKYGFSRRVIFCLYIAKVNFKVQDKIEMGKIMASAKSARSARSAKSAKSAKSTKSANAKGKEQAPRKGLKVLQVPRKGLKVLLAPRKGLKVFWCPPWLCKWRCAGVGVWSAFCQCGCLVLKAREE